MNLEAIQKMLEKRENLKKELDKKIDSCEDVTELRNLINQADSLDEEIVELRNTITLLSSNEPESRGATTEPAGGFNPIATYRNINQVNSIDDEEDKYASLAYRKAFKDYVVNGVPIPDEYRQEQRDNQLTMVGDVGAVIPTNLLNKVIEDMTVEGKILSRITQTSFQGGVHIPISDLNPVATWLNDESVVSDTQKAEMNAKLTFGYHVLEARVAVGLLTSTVTLNIFENTVVKQLKKAMIRAIETAIIAGTGEGQPKGITTYSLPANQVVKMTPSTIGTVKAWADVESRVPEVEEDSVIYVMNKATWEKYLNGMTDSIGQRIGLGKINEKGQKILNGREVLTCDNLPSFDGASDDDIFALVVDLSKYMLNSNLAMYYKKYYDENTNKYVHKSLMIVDGKMAIGETTLGRSKKLVGAKGLIYLTKGSE